MCRLRFASASLRSENCWVHELVQGSPRTLHVHGCAPHGPEMFTGITGQILYSGQWDNHHLTSRSQRASRPCTPIPIKSSNVSALMVTPLAVTLTGSGEYQWQHPGSRPAPTKVPEGRHREYPSMRGQWTPCTLLRTHTSRSIIQTVEELRIERGAAFT